VRSNLLQFFDDVISDGIEWGETDKSKFAIVTQGGKNLKHSQNFLKIMIPKRMQGFGEEEGKKERNFTFVLDSLGQNHEEKKSNFTPILVGNTLL